MLPVLFGTGFVASLALGSLGKESGLPLFAAGTIDAKRTPGDNLPALRRDRALAFKTVATRSSG
jgi:hypothetical protein